MMELERLLNEHPELKTTKVTYADLLKAITEVIKGYEDGAVGVVDRTFKFIEKTIDQLRYERIRDRYFITSIIAQINHVDKESIDKNYQVYCEEFDRLNLKGGTEDDHNGNSKDM